MCVIHVGCQGTRLRNTSPRRSAETRKVFIHIEKFESGRKKSEVEEGGRRRGDGRETDRETKKSLVRCQRPSQGQADMPPLSCEKAPPTCRHFVSTPCCVNPSHSTISFLQQINEKAGKSSAGTRSCCCYCCYVVTERSQLENHLIESSFPDYLNSEHDWSEFRLKCLSANLLSPESTNRFR